MSRRPPPQPKFDVDPLRVAVGVAALAGLLSVFVEYFDGLVIALAALAAAVWLGRSTRRPRFPGRSIVGSSPLVRSAPLLVLVAGGLGFAWLGHGPWTDLRGVVLGFSAVPLGWNPPRPLPEGFAR